MRCFCTYFDHHYLPRGLALYHSLQRHCPSFQLWVLCLSGDCHEILSRLKLPGMRVIALEELEQADGELLAVKPSRSMVEYYFTCTPSLLTFVFQHCAEADLVTYLDSDLFFFSTSEPVFGEMAGHSIAIIEHRFAPDLRHLEATGIYNVGWVSFRRDERAFVCLRWWRERCLEWCHDRVEPERYGDQKYLDRWPSLFPGVTVLKHKGANLAPWNLGNYQIRAQAGRVWVDEDELIFFHFHGFQKINDWLYKPNLVGFGVKPTRLLHRHVFQPYREALAIAGRQLSHLGNADELPEGIRHAKRGSEQTTPWGLAYWKVRRFQHVLRGILTRKYVLARPVESGPSLIPPASDLAARERQAASCPTPD